MDWDKKGYHRCFIVDWIIFKDEIKDEFLKIGYEK